MFFRTLDSKIYHVTLSWPIELNNGRAESDYSNLYDLMTGWLTILCSAELGSRSFLNWSRATT